MLVVWDIENNKEFKNYSVEGRFQIIHGESSKIGYLLAGNYYVNLDYCLANYFFDHNFNSCYFDILDGYKMSAQGIPFVHNFSI